MIRDKQISDVYQLFLILLLLTVVPALPAYGDVGESHETEAKSEADIRDGHVLSGKPYTYASLQSGYLFVTPDGPTGAAAPYGRLKSGPTAALSAGTLNSDLKLALDGQFLNEDDYRGELSLDYSGYYRLHVEGGALWHNLLPERLPQSTDSFRSQPLDTGASYGLRTTTTLVENRIKLGNNPFHINLGYWQLTREGTEQVRFSDYNSGGSNLPGTPSSSQNTVYSLAMKADRITREGNVGVSGHLGWFDLAYVFTIRDFINSAADSRVQFNNTASGALIAGNQAVNVIPDSRVTSHTIKLFSDLSGGLVGSAAYTLTRRENNGGHGDAVPSSQPVATLQSAAGNISYTPSKEVSLALKYRHQEINREAPATVYYPYAQTTSTTSAFYTSTAGTLVVRQATDTVKDTLVLSSIFRPNATTIYRLEYSGEIESRDNLSSSNESPYALHSDTRQTHTGTASFSWKPAPGLKLNASYSYAACDNPAYGASFSERHTGKLLLTYVHDGHWGLTSSYLARYETSASSASTVTSTTVTVDPASVVGTFNLPRENLNNTATVGFWFSPLDRLTVTTSYSFLQSDTAQTLLLNSLSQSALLAANYRSTAHVYGIDAVYAASDRLDLSLGLQQVRSDARFSVPSNVAFSATNTTTGVVTNYSSSGIGDLSKLVTTETGISTRVDWRITDLLGCVLDYGYRLYDSDSSVFDGSVHTATVSVRARW